MARLFAGLPGVPTRVRMVPDAIASGPHCHGLPRCRAPVEEILRGLGPGGQLARQSPHLRAAARPRSRDGPSTAADARDAVKLWALLASGIITTGELQRAAEGDLFQS